MNFDLLAIRCVGSHSMAERDDEDVLHLADVGHLRKLQIKNPSHRFILWEGFSLIFIHPITPSHRMSWL